LYKLLKDDHEPLVVSFDFWQKALELFKPHVVVLNHLHGKRNKWIANYVKRQGGLVVIIPTEGRPNSDDQAKWFYEQLDNPDLDLLCAWNDIVSHEKITITGCPRFDIYHNYRHLIEPKELFCNKYRLDPDKKIIGIATSFSQAKFAYKAIQFNKKDWKDLKVTSISGRDDPQQFAQSEYEYMQEFRLWLRVLKYRYPDYQYVLKPHPMGDATSWAEFCDEVGITIIYQEYIFNFLNAIDLLIARLGCITIQEAWLLDKPVVQIGLSDEQSGAAYEAYHIGYGVGQTSMFEFTDLFDIDSPYMLPEKYAKEYLAKYGYTTSNASQKTVDAIQALIDTNHIELVAHPTIAERSELNKLIYNHALANTYPDISQLHLGKSVTQGVINGWTNSL
jgi:surface carbohydrate biosynthesis protein